MANPDYKIIYKQLFINNEYIDSENKDTIPVINPSTEDILCHVSIATKADVDKAVVAARKALDKDSPWRTCDASERGRLMNNLANLIEKNVKYMTTLESLDNGKSYEDASEDVSYTIQTIRYYAGFCDKIHGKTIPCDGDFICMTRKEPVGVVGQIIPWNYPLLMLAWKWGPALAAGCTIVMKPSEITPLNAIFIGSLVKEAGFPPGVINILPGYGSTTGAAITQHPDIDKVAFTGSTLVGHKVMEAASASNLKRMTFELGGKSPVVVCEDCGDLDEAVKICHGALFNNHGQNCCAGTRTFVHSSIYDSFVEKARNLAKNRVVGDPFKKGTQQGPLISETQMKKVLNYISKGISEGAKLEVGGKRMGSKGFFVEPTVFSAVTDDMTIAREEIFGPVQSILKYTDFDDVIKRANDTKYGLASGIITKDLEKAMMFAQSIQAGSCWINCYDVALPQTPFGGYKMSGQGRELGEDGLHEYLETKTIVIRVPKKL